MSRDIPCRCPELTHHSLRHAEHDAGRVSRPVARADAPGGARERDAKAQVRSLLGVAGNTTDLVITVRPPERGAPRSIEPKGLIDAGGADLLMRVLQFVTGKSGQRAVVDFSGVTAISSEAQRALDDHLEDRAAGTAERRVREHA